MTKPAKTGRARRRSLEVAILKLSKGLKLVPLARKKRLGSSKKANLAQIKEWQVHPSQPMVTVYFDKQGATRWPECHWQLIVANCLLPGRRLGIPPQGPRVMELRSCARICVTVRRGEYVVELVYIFIGSSRFSFVLRSAERERERERAGLW